MACWVSDDLTHTCDDKLTCLDAGGDAMSGGTVYVSVTGSDSNNSGTDSRRPLKTVGAALALRAAVVNVCEGGYPENVTVSSATQLVGGFDCGTWAPANKLTTVAPTKGMALIVSTSHVSISGMSFTAVPADAGGGSSVAAFVTNALDVKFTNVTLTAGAGANGAIGMLTTVSYPTTPLDGNDADGGTGGPEKTCTCPGDSSSFGGAGGNYNQGGQGGSASPPTGLDGGAGGPIGSCSSAIVDGSNAPNGKDGTSVQVWGSINSSGWMPTAGGAGLPGGPGQGGGGGGGPNVPPTGAGGGGGCGSCGGAAATGGTGGGASIALLSLASDITLTSCTLVAATPGDGGKGIAGQPGQSPAGIGGIQTRGGCQGGRGGLGSNGGAGAGGAGGVSAGILYQGTAPTPDEPTKGNISFGQKGGARGLGGAAPDCTSAAANCGVDGVRGAIVELRAP